MVPVDKESLYYPKDDRPQSLPTYTAAHNCSSNDAIDGCRRAGSPSGGGATGKSMATIPTAVLSPEEENRKDIDAFMGKIDSTLAQTRKYVAKSQSSFEWVEFLILSYLV